jgi:hypothetical protein
MRNELVAFVVRKIERVTRSTRQILTVSRQAGAAESPAMSPRTQPMTRLLCAVAATALLATLSACGGETVLRGLASQAEDMAKPQKPAQTAQTTQTAQGSQPAASEHHGKKSEPKPEPTQQELFEYVRGKLLSLSPTDGYNDNLEVSFDSASSTLSITQPDGRCDIFLNSLDTNSAIWEEIDPSDTYHPRGDVLRLTLTSSSGKPARVCYDNQNHIDKSIAANRVRLLFAQSKANAVPDFTYNMTKAIKKLVVLCGGAPEKKIF